MRVLGIDCGVERTGYGVIESDGRTHSLLVAGVIRTSPSASVNVKTALKLAHVRGIALLVVAEAGLVMGEYSPLEVKSSVVGYGRAEKHQVQMMVRSLLGLDQAIESEDACDAVAVAICHANRQSTERRLTKAVS
jgi:crossover junction endodeoxyribonuclease RuvC